MTTEHENGGLRDAQISARYRELAREEPPARLDAAILDAARSRAARPGRRRWAVPVSLAAVLVLSVLVTTRIYEEAPDLASVAPAPAEKSAQEPARPSQRGEARLRPERSRADASPRSAEKREAIPFAATPRAPARDAETEAARPAERSAAGAAPAAAAGSLAAPMVKRKRTEGVAFEESPQEWLAHIARLRNEGLNAEADKSLAQFRQRYPDYRIPEEMRAKVLQR